MFGLDIRLIGALALALVVAGLYYTWEERGAKIEKQAGVIVTQGVQINTQRNEIVKDKGSDAATDKVTTKVAVAVQKVQEKTAGIIAKRDADVAKVDETFAALPVTVENTKAKADAVAKVNVTAMWSAYCSAEPAGEGCAPVAPEAPPAKKGLFSLDTDGGLNLSMSVSLGAADA